MFPKALATWQELSSREKRVRARVPAASGDTSLITVPTYRVVDGSPQAAITARASARKNLLMAQKVPSFGPRARLSICLIAPR